MKTDNSLLNLIAIVLLVILLIVVAFFFPSQVSAYTFPSPTSTMLEPYVISTYTWDMPVFVYLDQDEYSSLGTWLFCKVRSAVDYHDLLPVTTDNDYLYHKTSSGGCRDNYVYNGSWDTTSTTANLNLDRDSSFSSQLYSSVDVYADMSSYTIDYGSAYGGLGEISGHYFLMDNNIEFTPSSGNLVELGSEPDVQENYQYYFEYYDSDYSTGYIRLEFSDTVTVDSFTTTGETEFNFSGDYAYLGMSQGGLAVATPSETPPSFEVDDLDEPCANVKASNYYLKDDSDSYICDPTFNPIVSNLAPPYTGLINFDSTLYDWGTYNFLLTPFEFLFDAIDDVVGWFYGLWEGLLSLIIPMPNLFAWFAQDIRLAVNEVFPFDDIALLIDGFTDALDTDVETMPTVFTGSLMGVEANFVDFTLIDDNISDIRVYLQGFVILSLVVFNINLISKLLGDNKMTD